MCIASDIHDNKREIDELKALVSKLQKELYKQGEELYYLRRDQYYREGRHGGHCGCPQCYPRYYVNVPPIVINPGQTITTQHYISGPYYC